MPSARGCRCRIAGLDLFFFFSSRRRHTRFDCDWSSDVCSSDLSTVLLAMQGAALTFAQIRLGLADGMDYLESRSVPRTASARALTGAGAVREIGRASCRGRV